MRTLVDGGTIVVELEDTKLLEDSGAVELELGGGGTGIVDFVHPYRQEVRVTVDVVKYVEITTDEALLYVLVTGQLVTVV